MILDQKLSSNSNHKDCGCSIHVHFCIVGISISSKILFRFISPLVLALTQTHKKQAVKVAVGALTANDTEDVNT